MTDPKHRSFPEVPDGRPLPPMGYELLVASAGLLDWDGAAEIARNLARTGDLIPRDEITPAMAAEVLLNGVPNPIFDNLKYPLSGEFKVSCFGYDEDGADAEWEVTVGWPTIKDIIRAALTAIKESNNE